MTDFPCCKLEIFIPESHLSVLQQALWETDAGHIGKYDCCLFTVLSPAAGVRWRGSHPYLGTLGQLRTEPELKVEVACPTGRVEAVLAAVKRVHPTKSR